MLKIKQIFGMLAALAAPAIASAAEFPSAGGANAARFGGQIIYNSSHYSSTPGYRPTDPYNGITHRLPVLVEAPKNNIASGECDMILDSIISGECETNNNCANMNLNGVYPRIVLRLSQMPNKDYMGACQGFINTAFARYKAAHPDQKYMYTGATAGAAATAKQIGTIAAGSGAFPEAGSAFPTTITDVSYGERLANSAEGLQGWAEEWKEVNGVMVCVKNCSYATPTIENAENRLKRLQAEAQIKALQKTETLAPEKPDPGDKSKKPGKKPNEPEKEPTYISKEMCDRFATVDGVKSAELLQDRNVCKICLAPGNDNWAPVKTTLGSIVGSLIFPIGGQVVGGLIAPKIGEDVSCVEINLDETSIPESKPNPADVAAVKAAYEIEFNPVNPTNMPMVFREGYQPEPKPTGEAPGPTKSSSVVPETNDTNAQREPAAQTSFSFKSKGCRAESAFNFSPGEDVFLCPGSIGDFTDAELNALKASGCAHSQGYSALNYRLTFACADDRNITLDTPFTTQ